MSLKSEISARTTGQNAIEMTKEILAELSYETRVKASRVVLVTRSEYGFWRWKEAGHLSKERCEPGDWIVIDETSVTFKTQEQFDAAGYGKPISPKISDVMIY